MITKNTVFILGAGASKPFGYPTGIELREIICKSRDDSEIAQVLAEHSDEVEEYREAVAKFRVAFFKSLRYSIDDFLEHRQDYMRIGKMAIAQALIPLETESRLFEAKDNWFMYLYERLNTSFEEFDKNNVSFISFNYDRSLEQSLFLSLKNSYTGKTDEQCIEKLSSIPIIHLYGQLGFLPWQQIGGYSYNRQYNLRKRFANSQGDIQIASEGKDIEKSEAFQKAYKLIANAEQIYILGFSYSPTNLERLKIAPIKDKTIFGTAFNLERSKRTFISKQCADNIFLGKTDQDALAFLKEHLMYE